MQTSRLQEYAALLRGVDSPESLEAALRRLTSDAENNDPDGAANYMLALLYGRSELYHDQGPLLEKPDLQKCLIHLRTAAEFGSAEAQFQLCHAPEYAGLSDDERHDLLHRAAQAMLPEAVAETAIHELHEGDTQLAFSLCEAMYYTHAEGPAAGEACYLAALLTHNRIRAELFCRRAVKLGHRGARKLLASLLRSRGSDKVNDYADFLMRWYDRTASDSFGFETEETWPYPIGVREPLKELIETAMIIDAAEKLNRDDRRRNSTYDE